MTSEMGCIQERRCTTNGEREAPQRGKAHAFQVGSGRGHDWQRPLPMMAANAANDGSGRCQPKFIPKFICDDEINFPPIRNLSSYTVESFRTVEKTVKPSPLNSRRSVRPADSRYGLITTLKGSPVLT